MDWTEYAILVREKSRAFEQVHGRKPAFFVDTYGCQQNESDSELYRGMAMDMGYVRAEDEKSADLIVVNTCAVREHAEMRILGNVGALSHEKRRREWLVILMAGCMMSEPHVREKIKKSFPYVSGVIDTASPDRFPELLFNVLESKKHSFITGDDDAPVLEHTEGMPRLRDGGLKAWLPIMKGCNNFCSYCVVPYVRGREESRNVGSVLREAERLIADGAKDITLLGQNVNSYAGGCDFPALLREIDKIPGEYRLRFMTSHPKDAGEELFRAMSECGHVCPSLHLPFQSGSDRILRAMNRGYTSGAYREKLALARRYVPDITLTSDVIVGFPGETEEDFLGTLSLVEDMDFASLFTFVYSPRRGTKACDMEQNSTKDEIRSRFDRIMEAEDRATARQNAALLGKRTRVLVDGVSKEKNLLNSRDPGGRLVLVEGPETMIGQFRDVVIDDVAGWSPKARPAD